MPIPERLNPTFATAAAPSRSSPVPIGAPGPPKAHRRPRTDSDSAIARRQTAVRPLWFKLGRALHRRRPSCPRASPQARSLRLPLLLQVPRHPSRAAASPLPLARKCSPSTRPTPHRQPAPRLPTCLPLNFSASPCSPASTTLRPRLSGFHDYPKRTGPVRRLARRIGRFVCSPRRHPRHRRP